MLARFDAVVGSSLLFRIVSFMDERSAAWLKASWIGRIFAALADAVTGSRLVSLLLGLGAPAEAVAGSRIGRTVIGVGDALGRWLGRPAERLVNGVSGSWLGRWWSGSLISRVATYEAGVLFVLAYVPLNLALTRVLPYFVKWAAEGVLLLMLVALALEILTGRKRLTFTALDGPVLLWIGVSVISFLLNGNPLVQSVMGLRAMFQYYLLALIVTNAGFSRQQIGRMLGILLALVVFQALFGVGQWVLRWETPPDWVDITETNIKTRAFGTMMNPNTFAGWLALWSVPMFALWTVPLPKWGRFLLLGTVGAVLLAIVMSYSRSALLAMAVGLLLLGIVKDRRIIVVMVLAGLMLPVVSPNMTARLAKGFSISYFTKSSAGGRIDWWQKALQVNELNPLFGVGPGQYGGAAANYYGTKAYTLFGLPDRFPLWVDSQIFQYIAEVGYLGLLAFIWLLLTVFRAVRDVWRRGDEWSRTLALGFAGSLLGLMLMSLLASMWEMQPIASVAWFGMALVGLAQRGDISQA